MNKWQTFVEYLSNLRPYNVVTREMLFQWIPGVKKEWQTRKHYTLIDTYRKILDKAGFLAQVDKGVYCIKKKIPKDLAYRETKYKAYPKCKESDRRDVIGW